MQLDVASSVALGEPRSEAGLTGFLAPPQAADELGRHSSTAFTAAPPARSATLTMSEQGESDRVTVSRTSRTRLILVLGSCVVAAAVVVLLVLWSRPDNGQPTGWLIGDSPFERVTKLGGKYEKVPALPDSHRPELWDIDLSGTGAGDADLTVVGRRDDLDRLDLSFTAITDQGLKDLGPQPWLHEIDLTGTKVTDEGVRRLKRFSRLGSVSVARTAVTEEGTAALLRDFPPLRLCRYATGDKGQFRIVEWRRGGHLARKYLRIGHSLFAVALPPSPAERPEEPDGTRLATTYYHRHGPVGQILSRFDWFPSPSERNEHWSDARLPASVVGQLAYCAAGWPAESLVAMWTEPPVGVIRLYAGTLACYCRPLQFFDFYDSTPALQQLCMPAEGQPPVFHFVHDALQRGGNVRLLTGDERPTLARHGPQRFYSALFVEITREGLRDINTALMTREGMAELMGSLRQDGLLCYHVSHRYHRVHVPLIDAAGSLGYACKLVLDRGPKDAVIGQRDEAHYSSDWLVVAREPRYLESLRSQGNMEWLAVTGRGLYVWRDGEPHDLKPLEREKD
jgi:hypothetical protein